MKDFLLLNRIILVLFIFPFSLSFAQQIVEIDGKYAVIGSQNKIVAEDFDSIMKDAESFDDENPFFTFYKQGKQAILFSSQFEKQDWSHFTCAYDEVRPSICYGSTAISFIVRKGDKFGLIEENGIQMVPCIYDSVYQKMTGSKILIVRSGEKFDFLDLVLDADTPKSLLFPYDQIYPETERGGFTNVRIGSKYGFYFNGMNGNYYIRGMENVIYDSLITADNYFLKTWSADTLVYFYINSRLPHYGKFYDSEIYFAEHTKIVDVQSKEFLIHNGANRKEHSLFIYPMLYVDIQNENGFYYYDLSDVVKKNYFQSSESVQYNYEIVEFPNQNLYHPDTLFLHLIRVKEYKEFTPIISYYTVQNPEMIIRIELKEGQTIRFEQYLKNPEYAKILTVSTLPNSKGKYKTYHMNGYVSGNGRTQFAKPPNETGSFSGNGGGGNSGWMDFLWMGGR